MSSPSSWISLSCYCIYFWTQSCLWIFVLFIPVPWFVYPLDCFIKHHQLYPLYVCLKWLHSGPNSCVSVWGTLTHTWAPQQWDLHYRYEGKIFIQIPVPFYWLTEDMKLRDCIASNWIFTPVHKSQVVSTSVSVIAPRWSVGFQRPNRLPLSHCGILCQSRNSKSASHSEH